MANQEGTNPRGKSARWSGGRYMPKRKSCSFCSNKVKEINYKDTSLLLRYISDRGKIESRRRTGTCARHQRALATAIKRARHLVLLPYVPEHIYRMGSVSPLSPPLTGEPRQDKPATAKAETETAQTASLTEQSNTPIKE